MNRADLLQAPRGCWIGLAGVLLLAGCNGKVPTWNELTNQQPATNPNSNVVVSPSIPVQVDTPAPPKKTPLEQAEEVIANFKKLGPGAVTNEAIAALTALQEGAELVTEINAAASQVTDEGLANLHKLTSLKALALEGTKVGDRGCEAISQVPSLEELTLTGGLISDVGVTHLQNMVNLKKLMINDTQLTTAGFAVLGQLPALEEIWIQFSSLNDESMAALCEASSLRKLWMRRTGITDKGLGYLRKLERLEELNITDCQVTCEGLATATKGGGLKSLTLMSVESTRLNEKGAAAIGGMKNLESLNISNLMGMQDRHFIMMVKGKKNLRYLNASDNLALTNAATTVLKELTDLETLYFSGMPAVNDQCLVNLTKMKKLKEFRYTGTGITATGVQRLAAQLPELNKSSKPDGP